VDVAYPKKDDDEGEGGEDGMSERECNDGRSCYEPSARVAGRDV
jgi:hypothetical protein